MPFTILVTRDYEHVSDVAGRRVQRAIAAGLKMQDEYVLGLATGSSPVGLYRRLAAAANRGAFDSERLRSFNLDEYVGLPGENAQQRTMHPESYCSFMTHNLFALFDRPPRRFELPWANVIDQPALIHELNSHPGDWKRVGRDEGQAIVIRRDARSKYLRWVRNRILDGYPRLIRKAGGVDLQILGVGGRGHIAFHEAGIPFRLGGLLLVELESSTIRHAVEDGHFPSAAQTPHYALTMSIALVFKARQVVLLANGARKRAAVGRAVLEPPSAALPVSYCQTYAARGGELTWVVDEVAAADLLANRKAVRARGVTLRDLRKR